MQRKWSLRGIKARILLSFTIVLVFIGILLSGIISIQISLSGEINDIYDSNRMILILTENVHDLKLLTEQYLSTKTTESLEEIHNIINSLNLTVYEMKMISTNSQANMKIRDIGYMTESLINHVNIALRAKMDANVDKYTNNFEQITTIIKYIDVQCYAAISLMTEENFQAIKQHDERQFEFYQFAVLFIIMIAIECCGYIVLSSREIAEPIINMADCAKEIAAGNFNVKDVTCTSHDEVAALAVTFNQMKSNIRNNIRKIEQQKQLELELVEKESENYRIELMLQDAQLIAMQSQIQPHFLFNTINAGLQIAYQESADNTVEYFSQMSDFLRYSLHNFWEPVSLHSEVEQIKRYFYIMEKRFGTWIEFNVQEDIPEEKQRKIMVPCMILQPLVENCYAHGIKNVQRPGKIQIALCVYNGRYAVRIEDNGKGMSKDIINRLLEGPLTFNHGTSNVHRGLGIQNVIGRLRNYYKRNDVMEIYSMLDQGTKIVVLLEDKE